LYFPWCRHFALDQNFEFSPGKKKANMLIYIGKKFKVDNLCNKPVCHIVLEAFSVSKNSAAVMQ
jgi:hypothetical protein